MLLTIVNNFEIGRLRDVVSHSTATTTELELVCEFPSFILFLHVYSTYQGCYTETLKKKFKIDWRFLCTQTHAKRLRWISIWLGKTACTYNLNIWEAEARKITWAQESEFKTSLGSMVKPSSPKNKNKNKNKNGV